MTAPGAARGGSGWYRSGARRRTVSMDDARRMSNSAWANSSRLMSGLILYTGLGWLVSRWVGHQALLMAIGAIVGLALSYYLMFKSLAQEARDDELRQGSTHEGTVGTSRYSRGMEEPGGN
jgi:ATP synthase protein I